MIRPAPLRPSIPWPLDPSPFPRPKPPHSAIRRQTRGNRPRALPRGSRRASNPSMSAFFSWARPAFAPRPFRALAPWPLAPGTSVSPCFKIAICAPCKLDTLGTLRPTAAPAAFLSGTMPTAWHPCRPWPSRHPPARHSRSGFGRCRTAHDAAQSARRRFTLGSVAANRARQRGERSRPLAAQIRPTLRRRLLRRGLH